MKKINPKVLVIIIACVCLLAVGIAFGALGGKKELKAGDAGKEIALKKGEEFSIKLDENPTTGFSWHYTIENENVISMILDEYKINSTDSTTAQNTTITDTDPGAVGTGGVHTWNFRAVNKGTTSITFQYLRAWDKQEVAQTLVYKFIVK